MSRFPRPRRLRRRLAAVTVLAMGPAGCLGNVGRAPTESVTGQAFGIEAATAQRTRIAAVNTETSFLGVIEVSADRIIAETDDPVVARNALSWKVNAIPAVQRAAHHPDPLVSYLDEWVLLRQMRDYLQDGPGRDAFGPHQDIAIDALDELELLLDSRVEEVIGTEDYRTISTFVANWAVENPIDNPLFVRPPVSSFAADVLGEAELGGLEAVGRLEELALDAQQMAQSYLAYTPKVVLWRAQLMVEEMLDTTTVAPLLSQVDRLELTSAATDLMETLPDLIRAERAATTAEVAAALDASLATLLGLAAREREIVLREVAALVRAERAALSDDVAEALIRTLQEGREEALVVIDHTLWRIALMAAALIILLAIIQYLLFRSFLTRRRGGPSPTGS